MQITRRDCLAAIGAGLVQATNLHAQETKESRIIVPVGPGGPMDGLARAIADELGKSLNRPFVVDNRGGAAGQIAATAVARAVGDSKTLLLGSLGIMGVSPHLYPNLPYDVSRDFTPVGLCARSPCALVVNPAVVPVRSVQEFTAWARAQKAPIPYASYGSGSVAHIAAEMYRAAAGVQMVQIPYRDVPRIQTDLVKGDVPLIFDAPSSYVAFAKEDRLRILAVTSKKPSAALPGVPTMDQSGFRNFDFSNWFALYMPKGVPAEVVTRVRVALDAALDSKRMKEQFLPLGLELEGSGQDDFTAFHAREFARWGAFIKQNDIRITG